MKRDILSLNQCKEKEMMNRLFTRMFGVALGLLLLSMPITSMGDQVFKEISCPAFGATILPPGERVEIDDIIVSANQDQIVTIKFSPPNFTIAKLSMKAREPVVINFSGQVEAPDDLGEGDLGLNLDCDGNGKLFITVVGSRVGIS